jgi:hypothetical protein
MKRKGIEHREAEAGGACSMHGAMRNANFSLESLKGRHHSEYLGVSREDILNEVPSNTTHISKSHEGG